MGKSEIDLAALIGSRICHDLISPIGAINNGLELLGMAGGTPGAEMDLITQSVENASARIRFFRIAYGAAGEGEVSRSEIVATLRDYSAGGRITLAWGPLEAQPRRAVRRAFLAIQCLESAMPFGGRIEVATARGTWTVRGVAEKLKLDPALWDGLRNGETGDVSPAQVQFALLPVVLGDEGLELNTRIGAREIALIF